MTHFLCFCLSFSLQGRTRLAGSQLISLSLNQTHGNHPTSVSNVLGLHVTSGFDWPLREKAGPDGWEDERIYMTLCGCLWTFPEFKTCHLAQSNRSEKWGISFLAKTAPWVLTHDPSSSPLATSCAPLGSISNLLRKLLFLRDLSLLWLSSNLIYIHELNHHLCDLNSMKPISWNIFLSFQGHIANGQMEISTLTAQRHLKFTYPKPTYQIIPQSMYLC